MAEKLKVSQAVIVEGKYDKIKLSNIIDAFIIETNGFGVYKDKEKMKFIKRLACVFPFLQHPGYIHL